MLKDRIRGSDGGCVPLNPNRLLKIHAGVFDRREQIKIVRQLWRERQEHMQAPFARLHA